MKGTGTGRRYQKPGAVCVVIKLNFTRGPSFASSDGTKVGDKVVLISRLNADRRLCLTADGEIKEFWADELQSQLFKPFY